MEYCNEGTLQQKIRKKHLTKESFNEAEIFKTFY